MLFRYLGALHSEEIQEILEACPGIAPALTATIEPLEQDALTPVKELAEAGIIANHAVVIPVSAIFGSLRP